MKKFRNQIGSSTGELIAGLIVICAVILGAFGWIANIFKIVDLVSDPVSGMFILRCVGIFVAPLGAVLGYM